MTSAKREGRELATIMCTDGEREVEVVARAGQWFVHVHYEYRWYGVSDLFSVSHEPTGRCATTSALVMDEAMTLLDALAPFEFSSLDEAPMADMREAACSLWTSLGLRGLPNA